MLPPNKTYKTARPGEWDRLSACFPSTIRLSGQLSFSIGIFEWVPTKGGGCKKAAAHKRLSGPTHRAKELLAQADAITLAHNEPAPAQPPIAFEPDM
jgi:hypothetical protein